MLKRNIRKEKTNHLMGVRFDIDFLKQYFKKTLELDEAELRKELAELKNKKKPTEEEKRRHIEIENDLNLKGQIEKNIKELQEAELKLIYQIDMLKTWKFQSP